jgi:hypothetical protein
VKKDEVKGGGGQGASEMERSYFGKDGCGAGEVLEKYAD